SSHLRQTELPPQRILPVTAELGAQEHQDQVGTDSHRPWHQLLGRIPVLSHTAKRKAHAGRKGQGRRGRLGSARSSEEAGKDTTERAMVRLHALQTTR